jgi:poly-beta-1,6-N-acetyl-D-glucosamine biosynthesis protein PgaD
MIDKRDIPEEPPAQYAMEVTLTVLFWGLWLYVIAPLLSIVLWLAGVNVFVEQMITLGGYQHFLEKLGTYGLVVFAIMCATFGWVAWNVGRYGKRNTRRRAPPPVTLKETATIAGLSRDAVRHLQKQRRLVVDFDEHNRLLPQNLPPPSTPRRA